MRRLHFGCGQNRLPEPWENFDSEVDIRKPLAFPIGSAGLVLAEHIIEHVSFREGLGFLQECWRILEPGGVLRLAFPDILQNFALEEYRALVLEYYNKQINSPEDAWLSILTDWGHQSCWTGAMAVRVLKAVGFDSVHIVTPGKSLTVGLSGVVDLVYRAETTAAEAIR
jgi:SAM-dependent methyltransferase